jgi:hypothetical protein
MRKPTHQPVRAVHVLYRMWWRHVAPLSVLERVSYCKGLFQWDTSRNTAGANFGWQHMTTFGCKPYFFKLLQISCNI